MFHRYDSPVFYKGLEYHFETAIPSLTEIRDKMTEVSSLPVLITEEENLENPSYSNKLAFACLPQVKLGLDFSQEAKIVSLEPYIVERTLCWTIELALRNLGGRKKCRTAVEDPDEYERAEARCGKQMYYYCHCLSERDLRRRHRRTLLWKWYAALIVLPSSLILYPFYSVWEELKSFWNGVKSFWNNLEWDFKWDRK
ncbi:hypothetical protein Pan241w_22560 [Gimesia alba]|uniref:Uncharacterized protein n=1 Tax=Gimesia alba TaxID=2527973 RepID=A0A517RE73_9PLAN|nr:hypothetical protein [Gimesia alba]QDT42175.1 hypothetical protein Pan241w_22560 [Gimesia alba]